VVLLTLPGCIVYEHEQRSSRGIPLSKAMESSATGDREPLHGGGSSETRTTIGIEPDVAVAASASSGGGDRDYSLENGVDVGYSVPFSGDIAGITWFTIAVLPMENEHNSFGCFLGGGIVDLKAGSLPDRAVKNPWSLQAGFTYRRYLSGAHTFISPYVTANVAYQMLRWDYRNPIIADGDTIRSDGLDGVGGYAGFGVATQRKSRLSFFGEAGFGGTAFLSESFEGFDNDVFHNFGYFSVKAGLSLKF